MNHVIDQIETFIAGGLGALEQAAFKAHVAVCPACAEALIEAQSADAALNDLFAPARPAAGFEDRIIESLRQRQSWLARADLRLSLLDYSWHGRLARVFNSKRHGRAARATVNQRPRSRVRRVAVGLAASLLLGVGLAAYLAVNSGRSHKPTPASVTQVEKNRSAVPIDPPIARGHDVHGKDENHSRRWGDARAHFAIVNPVKVFNEMAEAKSLRDKLGIGRKGSPATRASVAPEQNQMLATLYGKIEAATGEVAQRNGIDLVIADDRGDSIGLEDASAAEVCRAFYARNILLASNCVDLTEQVIALLDKKFTESASAAPSTR